MLTVSSISSTSWLMITMPPLNVLRKPRSQVDRVGVQVVGRLVEQQRVGVGEQDARQLDAAALTTRQGRQRLLEHPVGQAERVRDRRCLGLGGIAAAGTEGGVGPRVGLHGLLGDVRIGRAHVDLGLAHRGQRLVEAAGAEDAVARRRGQVAGLGVLRQVADLAGRGDRALGGLAVAGQHPGQGGLAGAVASDQADLVALVDAEGDIGHQDARAEAQLHIGDGKHEATFDIGCASGVDGAWLDVIPAGRSSPAHPTRR